MRKIYERNGKTLFGRIVVETTGQLDVFAGIDHLRPNPEIKHEFVGVWNSQVPMQCNIQNERT